MLDVRVSVLAGEVDSCVLIVCKRRNTVKDSSQSGPGGHTTGDWIPAAKGRSFNTAHRDG